MEIIQTQRYLRDMRRMGVSATDMRKLEATIIANPHAGDVIPGLAGLRKLRFGFGGRGKSGGGRAIYFLVMDEGPTVMMFAYAKSDQADLTPDQRRLALAIIKDWPHG